MSNIVTHVVIISYNRLEISLLVHILVLHGHARKVSLLILLTGCI